MIMLFILLLLLPGLRTEESNISNLLTARPFKYQPFEASKILNSAKPTKKGPILFPNDGPPPPPTPLIVTSRPLTESIRRSELNPNNTIQASSQLNQVTYRPDYLNPISSTPYPYSQTSASLYEFVRIPYDEVPVRQLSGSRLVNDYVTASSQRPLLFRGAADNVGIKLRDQNSNPRGASIPDYEFRDASSDYTSTYPNKQEDDNKYFVQHKSTLPPIYRAFSDHATTILSQQKSQATAQPKPVYEYQNASPNYRNYNHNSDYDRRNDRDHNSGENYAFSYTVKDHKTGDDFSHSQSSSGQATSGEYRVRLPDGRMQIVSYTADEGGYKADVRYDDFEDKSNINSPVAKGQYDDFDYRYLNNLYTINSSKGVTNDAKRIKDLNDGNLYVDYTDKAQNYKINDDHLQRDIFSNSYNNKPKENHNVFINNGINDDIYTDKTGQSNIGDYDHYEDKDYSSESVNYQPHKTKYSAYLENNVASNNNAVKSTVIPPYEQLKDLFVTRSPIFGLVDPKDAVTEKVVFIGGKKPLLTNIKNFISNKSVSPTPNPYHYTANIAPIATTPSSYLYSTITNLKNKLNLSVKPILSQAYLNKISKYLDLKY